MRIKSMVLLLVGIVIVLSFTYCSKGNDRDTGLESKASDSISSDIADITEKTNTTEKADAYRLNIEDEILASQRVLSREEVNDCGYGFYDVAEQYGYKEAVSFPVRTEDDGEYGTIELFYTNNDQKGIDITVSEKLISSGKLKPMAEITIRFDLCTVQVCAWVDDNTTIVLPAEVEAVLRTILCI